MPLQKNHITIPISPGLATGTDDKQLPIGQGVIEVQNVRQGRVGEVVPRVSTLPLGLSMVGTTDTFLTPWALGTLRGEMVSFSGVGQHPVNAYSPQTGKWATDVYTPGTFSQQGAVATQRRGPIAATPSRVAGAGGTPAMAYGGGYYFVAYQTVPAVGGSLVMHEIAIDVSTGTIVVDRIVDDGLGFAYSAVFVVNGYAVFARYTTAGRMALDVFQIAALTAVPLSTTFVNNVNNTSANIDIIAKNATTMAVLYGDSVTTNLAAVDFVPSTATVTNWIPRTSTGVAIPVGNTFTWMQDFGGAGTQSIVDTGGGTVNVQWALAAAGATRNATTTYAAIDPAPFIVKNVTGFTTTNSAGGEFIVLNDHDTTTIASITMISQRFAGVITGGQVFYRGTNMRSHAFTQGGDYYVWLEYPSKLSGGRFLARIETTFAGTPGVPGPGGIVAKTQNGEVSLPPFPNWMSHVWSPAANTWTMVDPAQLRLETQSIGYNPFTAGIELVTTSFKLPGDATMGVPREAIDSLFVPGGTLGQFDGSAYAEAGFAYNPESLSGAPFGGVIAGRLTSASTYYYKYVFSYTDAFGRIWRSAPSLTLVLPMGANTQVNMAFETLRISERSIPLVAASRKGVTIEIYRGSANVADTFQLVGTVANDIFVDTVAFTDTVPDGTQATGQFLYTNGGGVLPNDCIPGFSAITVANNRLFGVSLDDPQSVWVSNQFIPGLGIVFSEQNKLILRDQHGPVIGIAAQPNGVVALFKADAIYAIAGDGPDQAGRGGFQVQLSSIGTGTTNPRSIVETSNGTEFMSTGTRHGWFRLSTGLTPEYIGGPLERYVATSIVGAVLVPTEQSTRYYLATGGCLVHDLVTGIWSFDTGVAATCAVAYKNGAGYGTANPFVIIDSAVGSIGTDPTGDYVMRAVTPWVKMSDLRGYERFYKARGVGEQDPAETTAFMTVALQKDMIATNVVSQACPASGLNSTWNWEMRYSIKCEALRFVITAQPNEYVNGAALKWSAIVIEYGQKSGMRPGASGNRTV